MMVKKSVLVFCENKCCTDRSLGSGGGGNHGTCDGERGASDVRGNTCGEAMKVE